MAQRQFDFLENWLKTTRAGLLQGDTARPEAMDSRKGCKADLYDEVQGGLEAKPEYTWCT